VGVKSTRNIQASRIDTLEQLWEFRLISFPEVGLVLTMMMQAT
jgi:hypothetical protein